MTMQSGPDSHPSDDVLFDLVEGTLPRRVRGEVEQHVAACAACSAAVAAAGATRARLAGGAAIEPLPAAADERLHAAIASEWELRKGAHARRAALPAWRRRINAGLAMGLAAVVLGVGVSQLGTGDDEATTSREPASPAAANSGAGAASEDAAAPQAGEAAAEAGADMSRQAAPGEYSAPAPATATDSAAGGAVTGTPLPPSASKAAEPQAGIAAPAEGPDERAPVTPPLPEVPATAPGPPGLDPFGRPVEERCVLRYGSTTTGLPALVEGGSVRRVVLGPAGALGVVCYSTGDVTLALSAP